MVNIKISTDFDNGKELNGKDMAIVTIVNKNKTAEVVLTGGKGVNSKHMIMAMADTIISVTEHVLRGNPQKIKEHIRAAGEYLLEYSKNNEED